MNIEFLIKKINTYFNNQKNLSGNLFISVFQKYFWKNLIFFYFLFCFKIIFYIFLMFNTILFGYLFG